MELLGSESKTACDGDDSTYKGRLGVVGSFEVRDVLIMKKAAFLFFRVCCVTSSHCFGASDPNQTAGNVSAVDSNNIKTTAAGNTEFAFDLYGKLKNDPNAVAPKGNLFFSPYSISTALAMTYAGARGETEKQMADVLHFTLPRQNLYSAFGALQKQLVQKDKSCGYQLLLANALWGQKGEPFLKEFLDFTECYYGAGLSQLDFVNEAEQSRHTINSWVEEKTNNKIENLIPPGVKGILSFSPCHKTNQKKVKVITIDIAMDLARLPYYMPTSRAAKA